MSETVLFGKIKDPELKVLNFRGQDGGKARRSHRCVAEIHEGRLNDPSLDKELRVYEEGAGNITRAGCVALRDS